MRVTIAAVRAVQPEWFSRKNKKFFGDVWYRVYHGKVTGFPYMVRASYIWSDMFNRPKELRYRINPINKDTLKIEMLIDDVFFNLEDVKDWIKEH